MLVFTIIIFSLSKAVLGDTCDSTPYSSCEKPQREYPETIQEMTELCSKSLRYVECQDRYDKTCKDNDFFIPGELESKLNLLADICGEDTLLHAAVTENLKCLKASIANFNDTCVNKGPVLKAFDDNENYVQEGEDKHIKHLMRIQCTYHFYDVACFIDYVSGKCGTIAKDAAIEIFHRSYVIRDFCHLDVFKELAKEAETLEIDAEQRDNLSETFRRLSWE